MDLSRSFYIFASKFKNMRIRRFLHLAIIALSISNISVAQNVSHTFIVDGELQAKSDKIKAEKGDNIARYWARNENTGKVLATSWGTDKMYVPNHSIFFNCLVSAYANHYSLVLSPDIIWTVISQGFSHYVNLDPEAMRDLIVSHQGKMTLTVESKKDLHSSDIKWDDILNGFDKQIAENTRGNIADMMRADFSTTGKTERIASQIILMSSAKAYFDFVVHYFTCGIPSITIEGTPDDWKKVIQKTENLKYYHLGWWTDDLIPILKEFVAAAEGKPNRAFWQNIVMKLRPNEMRELGCGWSDEEPTEVDGWFLRLIPFDKNGRTPQKVSCETDLMLPNVANAPFTYKVLDKYSNTISNTPMDMIAGLVGIDVDNKTHTMRPKIGWMVCESNGPTLEERLVHEEELHIKNYVPEELRHIGYLPKLTMNFANKVKIPDWMDTLRIDKIDIRGIISPELENELPKRFPNREIYVDKETGCIITSKTCQAPENYVFRPSYSAERPKFPGDYQAFNEYIEKNRRIPISENNKKYKDEMGRVIWVEFIVEKDGSISDVKIERNVNIKEECEEEALRLIREMPKWIPGKKEINGVETIIRARESMSIDF